MVACITGQQSCTALLGAAKGVLAGTVSLAGFADVLIACVTAVNLPEVLAAAGVAVGLEMLYLYITCAKGGS